MHVVKVAIIVALVWHCVLFTLAQSTNSPAFHAWITDHVGTAQPQRWAAAPSSSSAQQRAPTSPHISFLRPGLYAATDVKDGEIAASIPISATLHVNSTFADTAPVVHTEAFKKLLGLLSQAGLNDPYCLLAIRLLYEKYAPKSAFGPFIASLPTTGASVLLFDDAEVEALQLPKESPLMVARGQHMQLLNVLFTATKALVDADPATFRQIFPDDAFSKEAFTWAYTTVLNYGVEIPLGDCLPSKFTQQKKPVELPAELDTEEVEEDKEVDACADPQASLASQCNGGKIVKKLVKQKRKMTASELQVFKALKQGLTTAVSQVDFLVLVPVLHMSNHANPAHANGDVGIDVVDARADLASRGGGEGEGDEGESRVRAAIEKLRVVVKAKGALKKGEEILVPYGSFLAFHRAASANGRDAADGGDAVPVSASVSSSGYLALAPLPLSNTQLMLYYGVATAVNEEEAVTLDLGLESNGESAESMKLKNYIIDHNKLVRVNKVRYGEDLDKRFLQALRVKHLTTSDLHRLKAIKYEFLPERGFYSLQNELKLNLQLSAALEDLLARYSTTLRVDGQKMVDLLTPVQAGKQGITLRLRNELVTVSYRQGLKRVFHSLILKSMSSIMMMFMNLTDRWDKDVRDQMQLCMKHQAALVAAGKMKQEDTVSPPPQGEPETASPAGGGKPHMNHRPPTQPPVGSNVVNVNNAQHVKEWRLRLENWQREFARWKKETQAWHQSNWTKWLSFVNGADLSAQLAK